MTRDFSRTRTAKGRTMSRRTARRMRIAERFMWIAFGPASNGAEG